MNEREKLLNYEPIFPLFLKFSLPAIAGMMVQALYNIVDRYFISNIPGIGSTAIGGVGITMPVMLILMGFTMLFGIGGAANISLRMGEGKTEKAEHILGNVAVLLLITAIGLNLIFLTNLESLLRLFGATEGNLGYAMAYINIILWGNLWNTFGFAMNHLIRAEGSPKFSMKLMITGAVVNVILDPIFIFETIPIINLPGLGLGVSGAAYATIIAQGVSFLMGVNYYVSGKSYLKLRLANFKLNFRIFQMIVAIGVSPFFVQIAGSLVAALFNNNLKTYGGDTAQGAYVIINTVATLFYMPIFGMNQGLQPIIGYNYGAKNFDRVKKAVKVGIIASSAVVVVGWIFIMVLPDLLVGPMTGGDEVLHQLTAQGLKKVELMMFVVGFQVISSNFFSSIGKARLSFFLSLSRQIFFLVPVLIILPKFIGLDGIWYAMPISDIAATILTFFFLVHQFKLLDEKHQDQADQKRNELTEP
ncbi:MAG: MATE family efflux transporter [Clostridiaceae bacterium]